MKLFCLHFFLTFSFPIFFLCFSKQLFRYKIQWFYRVWPFFFFLKELGKIRMWLTCPAFSCKTRFLVDDIPIRVFKNSKDLGVKFPFNQPMKLYSSLWNADDWATRGGLEKTDWSKAPFIASYRGFHIDGCEASVEAKYCATQGKRWWDQKEFQDLDAQQWRRLRWVRKKFTIYNYCTDRVRYPSMPPECKRDRDI